MDIKAQVSAPRLDDGWTEEELEIYNHLTQSEPMPAGAYGNNAIIKTISEASGIPVKTVRYVVLGHLYLVYEALAQGKEINLRQIGRMYFRFRKGRFMPAGGKRMCVGLQPDKVYLKFRASDVLKSRIRTLDPKTTRYRPARGFNNRGLEAILEYREKRKAALTK